PCAAVPDDDVAAAVFAARDHSLEVEVLDGVVLDVNGGPPDRRIERGAPGHGPAHQHAIDLEPQVVVQPPGPVPLHHEPAWSGVFAAPALLAPRLGGTRRFRSAGEVPLVLVLA